jgi:hypothetical protein
MPRPKLSWLVGIALAFSSAAAGAQQRKIKVVGPDSMPIIYAYIGIEGGDGKISDENGEVNLGAGKKQTLTVRVQRIGYQPWFGKVELPDTGATIVVHLPRLAQALGTVRVTGTPETRALQLTGFYDRWMMRQKGALSAVFIGPEEIEFRHPDKITNMLRGLNGVELRRSCENDLVAFSSTNLCQMAVLLDGARQCPSRGCSAVVSGIGQGVTSSRPNCDSATGLNASTAVLMDQFINAGDVAAIEVYSRGGNVPVSISASDQACGIIAIWTGARRP